MQKKCSIVLITNTKGIENKNLVLFNNTLQINDTNCALLPSLNPLNANLYVLSGEKIEEGVFVLSLTFNNQIGKVISKYDKEFTVELLNGDKAGWTTYENCKKIIATTDSSLVTESNFTSETGKDYKEQLLLPQLSQSFIKDYINSYNKNTPIAEVMVDYQEWEQPVDVNADVLKYQKVFFPKVNSSNEISISKVKNNYTKKEVIELVKDALDHFSPMNNHSEEDEDNWIEQNL